MTMRDDAEAVGGQVRGAAWCCGLKSAGASRSSISAMGSACAKGQLLVQLDDQLPAPRCSKKPRRVVNRPRQPQAQPGAGGPGFISQRSVDESAANLEVAEAKLAWPKPQPSACASWRRLMALRAFGGVNVGDYLRMAPTSSTWEDLDAVYVDFRLPERLQNKVKTGQTARVAFDALPGVQYSAVVLAINPQIDADGRSLAVRGCIDNRRPQLRPGMFARVTAVFGERSDANVVPEEAIVPDGAAPYVLSGGWPGRGQPGGCGAPRRLGARTQGLWRWWKGILRR